MNIHVGVVGGGSWGSTVAHLAAHNTPTMLWCRDSEVADAVTNEHRNPRYLPDHNLHPALEASSDLAVVVSECDVLVMAVPSHSFREVLRKAAVHLRPWVPVISVTKGLEVRTHARMSQIAEAETPGHPVGVLTGPNLAKEIMAGHAAASVVATQDHNVSDQLQAVFATDSFRVYTNADVIGCEIGGALKNVIALASGMADGLGTGDNTRAAIITRGLAELTRLAVAMGARAETINGLAGLGDLLATCMSPQSRNRFVGEELGRGRSAVDVVAEMDQIAEGVVVAPVAVELAALYGVEVPISEQVAAVVTGKATAAEAYGQLLSRTPTTED
jgi:glycerol-3-phosphate dehydrogenase (NAD(P)+)